MGVSIFQRMTFFLFQSINSKNSENFHKISKILDIGFITITMLEIHESKAGVENFSCVADPLNHDLNVTIILVVGIGKMDRSL